MNFVTSAYAGRQKLFHASLNRNHVKKYTCTQPARHGNSRHTRGGGTGPAFQRHLKPLRATSDNKNQSRMSQQPHEQAPSSHSQPAEVPGWMQQLQTQWGQLDNAQKVYAVVVGLAVLAALPKILTLLVLGLERILIGGLLAIEEVLLELVLKGGALLGLVGVVAVLAAGVYLFFLRRATK